MKRHDLAEIEIDVEKAFRAIDRVCNRLYQRGVEHPRFDRLRRELVALYDEVRWRQGKGKQRVFEE